MKTYNELTQMPENTVIANVVFREHTLGYLFKGFGHLLIGVWVSKITKGGQSWVNQVAITTEDLLKEVREATPKDFEYFMVSPKYH